MKLKLLSFFKKEKLERILIEKTAIPTNDTDGFVVAYVIEYNEPTFFRLFVSSKTLLTLARNVKDSLKQTISLFWNSSMCKWEDRRLWKKEWTKLYFSTECYVYFNFNCSCFNEIFYVPKSFSILLSLPSIKIKILCNITLLYIAYLT